MESTAIVEKLEATSPSPSLRLDGKLEQQAQDISTRVIFPMAAFLFNRIYGQIITEAEMDWFRADRENRLPRMLGRDESEHITLEQWEREAGGKSTFKASEPGMVELSKLLKEQKRDDGPFILGSEVSYADLMVAGLAEFFRRVGDGAYEKLEGSVPELKKHYEACSPWLQRNNY